MSEKALAKVCVDWLLEQDYEVYQEVQFSGRGGKVADIVAVRGPVFHIIECKTSLSTVVMQQASEWKVPFRSICVPAGRSGTQSKSRWIATKLAKNYFKVGVIEVTKNYKGVFEYPRRKINSPFLREYQKRSEKLRKLLKPEHKFYAQAGDDKRQHWTVYKSTIRDVKKFIKYHPKCTIKEIMLSCETHYASKSAKYSLAYALEHYEKLWCSVDKAEKPYKYTVVE